MKTLILLINFALPLLIACSGKKIQEPEKDTTKISCHSSTPSRFAKIDTKTIKPGIQNPEKPTKPGENQVNR
ncbi:hypothetical protein [Pedobacter immunditicola]|uniref:hypothetical protein n=1 Tax=Pedobacter immunditicola TaxID=3133440 RepID=UPI0030AFCF84